MDKKTNKRITSMEEFQKVYFPNSVGKICPHCGSEIDDGRSKSEPENPYKIEDDSDSLLK